MSQRHPQIDPLKVRVDRQRG